MLHFIITETKLDGCYNNMNASVDQPNQCLICGTHMHEQTILARSRMLHMLTHPHPPPTHNICKDLSCPS